MSGYIVWNAHCLIDQHVPVDALFETAFPDGSELRPGDLRIDQFRTEVIAASDQILAENIQHWHAGSVIHPEKLPLRVRF